MATIKTTVKIEIVEESGERMVVERELITRKGDNSRFFKKEAARELEAAGGSVLAAIENQWGSN